MEDVLFRVKRHQTHPFVVVQTLKKTMMLDNPADPFSGRFNQDEQAHRFMIWPRPVHDGLPRKPRAQIALGPDMIPNRPTTL